MHEHEHWFASRKKKTGKTQNCSRACQFHEQKKGRVIDSLVRQTSLNKFGTDHPTQSQQVKENFVKTSFERYGVTHPVKTRFVQDKMKKTCFERLGVENAFQNENCKIKAKQTMMTNHGVEYALQSSSLKEKQEKTSLARHGSKFPQQTEKVKNKIKLTNLEKYGHECTICGRNDNGELLIKGAGSQSKPENLLYEWLCIAGFQNVERQKLVAKSYIDFYLSNEDVFIQLDGVYWHGLNASFEEIFQATGPRAEGIKKTFLKDRLQDAYFSMQNMKLIRITDIELKSWINADTVVEELKKRIYG